MTDETRFDASYFLSCLLWLAYEYNVYGDVNYKQFVFSVGHIKRDNQTCFQKKEKETERENIKMCKELLKEMNCNLVVNISEKKKWRRTFWTVKSCSAKWCKADQRTNSKR